LSQVACVLGCRARRRADGADREGLRKAPPRSYTPAGGCTGSRVVNPGSPRSSSPSFRVDDPVTRAGATRRY
jgi:hypothetical protein